MKKITAIALAAIMMLSVFAGCKSTTTPESDQPDEGKTPELTLEERTEIYKNAILNSRTDEENEYKPLLTATDEENADRDITLEMLSLTVEDMEAYAISASFIIIQAYGVAVIMPAEGKEETVKNGLDEFVQNQQKNFENYLQDQYEVAKNAKIEVHESGAVILVMCENQDEVYDSIVAELEK